MTGFAKRRFVLLAFALHLVRTAPAEPSSGTLQRNDHDRRQVENQIENLNPFTRQPESESSATRHGSSSSSGSCHCPCAQAATADINGGGAADPSAKASTGDHDHGAAVERKFLRQAEATGTDESGNKAGTSLQLVPVSGKLEQGRQMVSLSSSQDLVQLQPEILAEPESSPPHNSQAQTTPPVVQQEQQPAPIVVEVEEAHSRGWYVALILSILCVLTAGMMSGLTMGLVSLDPFDMELLMSTDPDDVEDPEENEELLVEKAAASVILPLVTDHHRLLVTLLLMNACAAETLPLALDKLGLPKVVTILISVFGVLIFGEIIPSAVFTGPRQLEIASFFVPLVNVLEAVLAVIVIPIARGLDALLGKEHKGRYNKGELKALINLQLRENQQSPTGLMQDEIRMMTGAMELSKKTVADVMVPLNEVYMLAQATELNMETMATIVGKGHSRVPIYNTHPHDIRGFLMVKNLIVVNPDDKRKIAGLGLRKPLVVTLNDPLLDLLTEFQKGKSHIAIVTNRPDLVKRAWATESQIPVNVHMAGIVTLEDVIENLIQDDIRDESGTGEAGVREHLRQLIFKAKRVERVREVTALARKMFIKRANSGIRRRLSQESNRTSALGSPIMIHRRAPSEDHSHLTVPENTMNNIPYHQYQQQHLLRGTTGGGGGVTAPQGDTSTMVSNSPTQRSAGRSKVLQPRDSTVTYVSDRTTNAHSQVGGGTSAAAGGVQLPSQILVRDSGVDRGRMTEKPQLPSNFPTHLTQALLQTRDKMAGDRRYPTSMMAQHIQNIATNSAGGTAPPGAPGTSVATGSGSAAGSAGVAPSLAAVVEQAGSANSRRADRAVSDHLSEPRSSPKQQRPTSPPISRTTSVTVEMTSKSRK
ncbi:unnamed protein product [Amoebophrya sp. A120]|nr:unnamed protein product [Amoebophrya sp. A120]|eukprot:GSA120T00021458001.1